MKPEKDWRSVKKLLCVRLDSMGDVIMTGPAIRAIRESLPDASISILTSPSAARSALMLKEIDEVISYDAPWMKATAPRANAAVDYKKLADIREREFEAAVIFTVFSQSALPAALFCFLAGIPKRLAFSRENPYQLITDWVPEEEPRQRIRHEVERQLDLAGSVGFATEDRRLYVNIPDYARFSVNARLRKLGSEESPIILHPGATAESRKYPSEMFRKAAELLASQTDRPLIFTGSRAEVPLVSSITAGLKNAVSLAGELSIEELAALIKSAALLISNNTGPMHIAAATGTPIVALYALTNPQHTPWMARSRVLYQDVPCRYCYKSICPAGHHLCLRGVSPETVCGAALDLLNGKECTAVNAPPA